VRQKYLVIIASLIVLVLFLGGIWFFLLRYDVVEKGSWMSISNSPEANVDYCDVSLVVGCVERCSSNSCRSKTENDNSTSFFLCEGIRTGKIDPLIAPLTSTGNFRGDPCNGDCSGHKAGFAFAKKKGLLDARMCTGKSQSFVRGCILAVDEYWRLCNDMPETQSWLPK
jgi:hypothetical protein